MFQKNKAYDSSIQVWAMRSKYPQFKVRFRDPNDIEFIGELKVAEWIPEYTISISYRGALAPRVMIIKPELVEKPPHVYPDTRTLCLYHPDLYKWKRDRLIAQDIVSWSAAWIYFYEVWLQTGVWYGPEAPHDIDKKN